MKRIVWIVSALVAGANLIACGAPETRSIERADAPAKTETAASSLIVTGRVSSDVALNKARAVAVATDGTMIWAYLDKDGDFKLVLPVGQSYRVLIANDRTTGKGQEVVGQLMLDMGKGRTQWIGAKQSGSVDLGSLKPAGIAGAKTGGITIKTADMGDDDADDDADDDDDDDMDHSDDNECHTTGAGGKTGSYTDGGAAPATGDGDDDDDDDADLCAAGAPTELEASKTPSAEYCGDGDDDDDDDTVKACH